MPAAVILLATVYLLILFCLLLCGLVALWPCNEGTRVGPPPQLFDLTLPTPSAEIQLFLFVAAAGALGSMIHVLRSLYWYVGHRQLRWSWLQKYLLLPFVGSALAVIFYFVLRGALLQGSPDSNAELPINPFGFAAMAGLAGLFSEQAVEKLRQVFVTLLASVPAGADHVAPAQEGSGKQGLPSDRSDGGPSHDEGAERRAARSA